MTLQYQIAWLSPLFSYSVKTKFRVLALTSNTVFCLPFWRSPLPSDSKNLIQILQLSVTLHIACNNINFICNFKVWIVHLADHNIINSKTVASKWFEYVQININMRWSWILMDLDRLSFLKMMDWSREERNRLFTRLSCLVYIWEVYLTSQNSPSWAFIDWWLILVKYAFVGFIIRCTSFFRRCVC